MSKPSAAGATALVFDYADVAAQTGWSETSFKSFLTARGIKPERQQEIWPKGVRSAARDLNAAADSEMRRRWAGVGAPRLTEIVDARFKDNQRLKRSIGLLARSDALHPIDTLLRTLLTARAMIECRGGYRARSGIGRAVERWALVFAYCLCVLVWLIDASDDLHMTRGATSALVGLIGAN